MKTKAEWLADVANATRIIGIVPRVKAKADQEPSPTTLAIYDCGAGAFRPKFALADEQSELDFVLDCMPVRWMKVDEGQDLSGFKEHHVRLKKDPADKAKLIPDEVPTVYEGLKKGDILVSSLGGSGDNFNFALSRQAEEIGALVLRCPPFRLKEFRNSLIATDAKNGELDDSFVLVQMVKSKTDEFYPVFVRERLSAWMRECYRRRIDIMKARIACEQRLRQRFIGQIFCSAEGKYPEGAITKEFEKVVANDAVLDALLREEKSANTALEKACEALPVYTEVFGQVEGVGPSIASRLIAGIQDIRRFETKWKLRKFCGVYCLADGRFPRRRSGEVANWNPDCRQALFLLGDQFNRRPGTIWGDKLRANKTIYRIKHPLSVNVDIRCVQHYRDALNLFKRVGVDTAMFGSSVNMNVDAVYGFVTAGRSQMAEDGGIDEDSVKKADEILFTLNKLVKSDDKSNGTINLFSPGHIHKMALWKTLGEFTEWLFEEWWKLERAHQQG